MSEVKHAEIKNDHGMPVVDTEVLEGHRVGLVLSIDYRYSNTDNQVYIANLPFEANEQQVRDFVAPVGGEM